MNRRLWIMKIMVIMILAFVAKLQGEGKRPGNSLYILWNLSYEIRMNFVVDSFIFFPCRCCLSVDCMVGETILYTCYTNAITLTWYNARDSSGKEMMQGDDGCSMIEGFAFKVHSDQENCIFEGPGTKVIGFACDNIDKHVPHQSKSTEKGSIDSIHSCGHPNVVQLSLNKFVTINKRKHESVDSALSEMPLLRSGPTLDRSLDNSSLKHAASTKSPDNYGECDDSNRTNSSELRMANMSSIDRVNSEADKRILLPCGGRNQSGAKDDEDAHILVPSVIKGQNGAREKINLLEQKSQERMLVSDGAAVTSVSTNSQLPSHDLSDAPISLQSAGALTEIPVVSSGSKVGFTLQFSFKDLMSRRKQRLSRLQHISHMSERMKSKGGFASASLDISPMVNEEEKAKALAAATSELERLFRKEDFKQMKVIGQFNLGFIIGKLYDDLFMVDQHAADEKYNYERLSRTTILNQQPLLRPLKMELSPEEEIVVSMHIDTFRKNGFYLEEDMRAPSGNRFMLKAVPFSKSITFGIADVKELISILADSHGECSIIGSYRSDTVDSLCPPKVRAMLASRACKSSVVIGDSLGRNEMKKILEHLAVLKSPWNCPHGRPTMRHLVDLRTIHRRRLDEEEEVMEL